LAFAPASVAANCESEMSQQGSFPGARHYASRTSIAGLTRQIAFSQLPIIFADKNILVRTQDWTSGLITGATPASTFYPPQAVSAQFSEMNGIGTVKLDYSIKADVLMSKRTMTREICGALGRLTDASGRRATDLPTLPLAHSTTPRLLASVAESAPAPIEASSLAQRLLGIRNNPARIALQFGRKQLRVTGMVVSISEDYRGYAVRMEGLPFASNDLDVPDKNEMIIVCHVPQAQISAAAALTPNQRGTLTGRFDRLENHSRLPVISLEDCGR
jgi:hypothetical protein